MKQIEGFAAYGYTAFPKDVFFTAFKGKYLKVDFLKTFL